ncbi:hypothetical protein MIND_01311600 [Mycena indigotica]|uniref:Zn(2)-C6 fungal-type domain-containing protein n=1 Tax=Mycena indigotica TaxID=2126181 RepID=A0A8H6VWF1_9AGAR|nr:uncharacterized protein MIND_01311600 [Mycena indigotica]KAF7290709.1 hypothetical protein MIND_01311600 [Mycena indigotica]
MSHLHAFQSSTAYFHVDPRWQSAPPPTQERFEFAYPAPAASYGQLYPQYDQYAQYAPGPSYPPPSTGQPRGVGPPRKRQRTEDEVPQSAGYSEPEGDEGLRPQAGGAKLPGACGHCRKLKMKCEFATDADGETEDTCRRCQATGHVCMVERRNQRSAPNKTKYLMAQIRHKDEIIESLLKQIHNPYTATPMSIASFRMASSPSDANDVDVVTWLSQMKASIPPDAPSSTVLPQDDATLEGEETGGNEQTSISLPAPNAPVGLIAQLSLANKRRSKNNLRGADGQTGDAGTSDIVQGVASASYFTPGPTTDLKKRAQLIHQHSPPQILMHGLVTSEDVEKLFEIFYTHINPFINLLDPVLHTPQNTFGRCPFLYTVICAVSSRYSTEKAKIYAVAMHFAKQSAATALIDGWKSVELCQAYVLLSLFAAPTGKWEEDRSWMYAGLAVRLATDLNLDQVPNSKPAADETAEREQLNRTRVWLICFNLDRSLATQFGKSATIRDEDISRHQTDNWYAKSIYNSPYDIHLCCFTGLMHLVTRFYEALNQRGDLLAVTMNHDDDLTRFAEEWDERLQHASDMSDPTCALRRKLLSFRVAYSRLLMYSFGLQHTYSANRIFLSKCLESAKDVLRVMVDDLSPTGFLRYAPDEHFTIAAFACACIFRLFRPEHARWLSVDEENRAIDLVTGLIQTLGSPETALDDRHVPKQYARFLASVLARRRRDGPASGHTPVQPPPTQLQQQQTPTPPSSATSSEYGTLSNAFSNFSSAAQSSQHVGGYTAGGGRVYSDVPSQSALEETLLDLQQLLPGEEQLFAAALQNTNWGLMDQTAWLDSSSYSPSSDGSSGLQSPYHAPLAGLQPLAQFAR